MNNHIDKGNGFTHHDDTDCCKCPCKGYDRPPKIKVVKVKHSEERRKYWREAQRRHRNVQLKESEDE